jgi:hypothetical protein
VNQPARKQTVLGCFGLLLVSIVLIAVFPNKNTISQSPDEQMRELTLKYLTTADKRGLTQEAHRIGHTIAAENKELGLNELFNKCGDPSFLAGGCLHGVVMSFGDAQDLKIIASYCEVLHADILMKKHCAHGVGHSIMESNDLGEALGDCGAYFTQQLIADCASGSFMEYMLKTHSLVKDATSEHDISLPDCSHYNLELTYVCAGAVGSYTLYYPGSDLHKTVDMCHAFEQPTLQEYCLLAAHDRLTLATPEQKAQFCSLITAQEKLDMVLCFPYGG